MATKIFKRKKIECPFCGKESVNVRYTEKNSTYSYSKIHKAGKYEKIDGEVKVESKCENCGKTIEELEYFFKYDREKPKVPTCMMCGEPAHEGWTMCDICADKFEKERKENAKQ